jgi:hypothetical protein
MAPGTRRLTPLGSPFILEEAFYRFAVWGPICAGGNRGLIVSGLNRGKKITPSRKKFD